MTIFWLVRHGQTDWNLEGRYQGQSDIPLNATGLEQARACAARLNGQRFDALYSSDLLRARRTAEILGEKLALPVRTDTRLREINHGQWQGRTLEEIRLAYEDHTHDSDPLNSRAPGGESVLEVARRMAQAADAITSAHPGGTVMLVGHGLALAALYCQAQGIPLEQVYEHIPENTQATIIEW